MAYRPRAAEEIAYATREMGWGEASLRDLARTIEPGHSLALSTSLDISVGAGKVSADIERTEDGRYVVQLREQAEAGAKHVRGTLGFGTKYRLETAEGVADLIQAMSKMTAITAAKGPYSFIPLPGEDEAAERLHRYSDQNLVEFRMNGGLKAELDARASVAGAKLGASLSEELVVDRQRGILKLQTVYAGEGCAELGRAALSAIGGGSVEGAGAVKLVSEVHLTPEQMRNFETGGLGGIGEALKAKGELKVAIELELKGEVHGAMGGARAAAKVEVEFPMEKVMNALNLPQTMGELIDSGEYKARLSWGGSTAEPHLDADAKVVRFQASAESTRFVDRKGSLKEIKEQVSSHFSSDAALEGTRAAAQLR